MLWCYVAGMKMGISAISARVSLRISQVKDRMQVLAK